MFVDYLQLGIDHILDPKGLDHVLFIVVLCAPYLFRDWKKVILLASAFTIGHTLTLALSSLNYIKINADLIEICIAVSIALTAINNIVQKERTLKLKFLVATVFGLIHGMGFSNFFKSILGNDDILMPLLAFNLGVEIAQIIIILCVLFLAFFVVEKMAFKRKQWILFLSIPVLLWSIKLIVERI